jgi:4-amino-4-deoxy-L-arabinose transferase-like glycosyltransferase
LGLLAILLFLPRSPLPWLDEIYYASAALGRIRSGQAIPTAYAAFHGTGRLDLLYGPVITFLGSWEIRLFGLSATSWRLLGFLGGVGCVLSAAWVSMRLDRSPAAAAAAAMFVSLSQGMGARATSGRFDTLTVALELLTLGCTLSTIQFLPLRRSALFAVLGGVALGLAALSTPRSFPFALALFVALGLEFLLTRRPQLLRLTLELGVVALIPVWAWTFSQGITPLGWLRFIAAGSRGDKINVSPLLHGTWQLFSGPLIPLASGLSVIFVSLMVFRAAWATKVWRNIEETSSNSSFRVAVFTVLINYLLLLVMIARFWDYEIFVVPLLVPVLTALTAKIWRATPRRAAHKVVLASWLMLALYLIAIRSAKVAVWLACYRERDPQPLQSFVESKIPPQSRVFGPEGYYFYAVQAAGSEYLFARLIIPTALKGDIDKVDWEDQLHSGQPVYLLWPHGDALPPGVSAADLKLEATFSETPGTEPKHAFMALGYPVTNLYRLVGTTESQKNGAKATRNSGM